MTPVGPISSDSGSVPIPKVPANPAPLPPPARERSVPAPDTVSSVGGKRSALDAESRHLQEVHEMLATANDALDEMETALAEAESVANQPVFDELEQVTSDNEIAELIAKANQRAGSASFNGKSLLDGSATLTAGGDTLSVDRIEVSPLDDGEDRADALAAAHLQVSGLRDELANFAKYSVKPRLNAVGVALENMAETDIALGNEDAAQDLANLARIAVVTAKVASAYHAASPSNTLQLLSS